jgi:L-seryl-tRNA(Ser) seleniumtransferase
MNENSRSFPSARGRPRPQATPDLIEAHGRQPVTACVRAELAAAREGAKHGLPLPDEATLLAAIHRRAEAAARANCGRCST